MKSLKLTASAFVIALAVAGCESSEERAQKHFETAVELIQNGDVDRGLVELRNVFELDGSHRDARVLFAETQLRQGNLRGAYSQYLRLVEQYPEDLQGNRALAELAFRGGDPDAARGYADKTLSIAPDDLQARAVDAALDFRAAEIAKDAQARAEAVRTATELLQTDTTLDFARQVVIADLVSARKFKEALVEVDNGLKVTPDSKELRNLRVGILSELGDKAGMEAELREMATRFSDEDWSSQLLVRWYISEGRLKDAEDWLRQSIPADGSEAQPRLALLQFIAQTRGEPGALEDLDATLAQSPQPSDVAANLAEFKALHAGLMFNTGKRDEGMKELETLVTGAEPSDDVDRYKVGLAKMRVTTGNVVGARQLVEEVLEHDPSQISALKLKGEWLTEDDKTGDAIVTLRAALGEAPQDAEIMTLLAAAHEREGDSKLMREMLSRAVEASNKAPMESARYARVLVKAGEFPAAESVLIEALRLNSNNTMLLGTLGQVHLAMKDIPRAEQDIARLRELGTPDAIAVADELQARLYAVQDKPEEMTAFLEERAASKNDDLGAKFAVIRALLMSGEMDQALARAAELEAENPENIGARFIHATVMNQAGQTEEARKRLQQLVAEEPRLEGAWAALIEISMRDGDKAATAALLDQAQAALPESNSLKWARASFMERTGDVDGAIAIFEELYAADSNNMVVANNLASLISSNKADAASLDRAYAIARRLRDTEVPPFQDTYGWIAYLRGDYADAISHLEPAARGLPNDPAVQFHLGQAYAATSRKEDARAQFQKARDLLAGGAPAQPDLTTQIDAAETAMDAAEPAAPAQN